MLGRKYGYYPKDPMQAFECDELIALYQGILGPVYTPHFQKKADRKEAMVNEVFDRVVPKFLQEIDPKCGGDTKFLLGDKLTIADFWIGGFYTNYAANPNIDYAPERWAALLEEYPNFKAYGERFTEENKAYLKKRPSYPI